jgi:glycosyltransferase involved in cell wall biosynthesis
MSGPTIGLVAPLPPQIGGVARVAEWLLAHSSEIGCTYQPFDLRRPPDAASGGRLSGAAVLAQVRLFVRFVFWLPRAPRVVHMCVSCTPTGLPRDAFYVLLLAAMRRRTIAHVHSSELEVALRARSRGLALRTIGRTAAAVVAVSPRPAADLEAAGIEATHVFNPIGIDSGAPRRPERHAAPVQILFLGAYGVRKGVYDLLDAIGQVRNEGHDVRVRIVGPPEFPDETERLAAGVRDRGLTDAVALIGPVPSDDVSRELREADIFCLPSYREGLPMAILEAMAAGLPVVATPVGGIPDVVRDNESGLLLAAGDVGGLAAALAELARDPELRHRLGEQGRIVVEELAGVPAVAARWRELYESVATSS